MNMKHYPEHEGHQSYQEYEMDFDENSDEMIHKRRIRRILEEKLERKRLKEELEDNLDDEFDWSEIDSVKKCECEGCKKAADHDRRALVESLGCD